ncbi:hypothetical protein NL676_020363 [Syzygium grande]|nr:hypothetical protein NL676_020363 [Syzygium grande]
MHAYKKPTPQQALSISRFPCPVYSQAHTMPETASHVADDHDDKPHVAVLANSGLGHVIPLLEFSKRLVVSHGFRVTFLVVTTVDPTPAQDQLLNAPGLPHDLRVLGLPAVDTTSVVPEDSRVLTRICLVVEASLKSLKATLIELNYPRALVVDLFCTQAFGVASELGIPTYSFFTSSATMLAFSLYLPTLDREVTGELVDLPRAGPGPWLPVGPTGGPAGPGEGPKNEEYRWYLYHFSRLPMAAGIFLNTWEGLEPGSLRALREDSFYRKVPAPPVHAIGPLVHGGRRCGGAALDGRRVPRVAGPAAGRVGCAGVAGKRRDADEGAAGGDGLGSGAEPAEVLVDRSEAHGCLCLGCIFQCGERRGRRSDQVSTTRFSGEDSRGRHGGALLGCPDWKMKSRGCDEELCADRAS